MMKASMNGSSVLGGFENIERSETVYSEKNCGNV